MPGNLRVVSRKIEVPIQGGMTYGRVLEYLPPDVMATAAEEKEVNAFFRQDQARSRPGWRYFDNE